MMPNVLIHEHYSIDAYLNYFFILEEIVTYPSTAFDKTLFDKVKKLIVPLHEESMYRYSDNAEYLFWHGFMMLRWTWLFYPDDTESNMLLERAHEMEPDNKLYSWAISDWLERFNYGIEIINDDNLMNHIVHKGPVGIYLQGLLTNYVEHETERRPRTERQFNV